MPIYVLNDLITTRSKSVIGLSEALRPSKVHRCSIGHVCVDRLKRRPTPWPVSPDVAPQCSRRVRTCKYLHRRPLEVTDTLTRMFSVKQKINQPTSRRASNPSRALGGLLYQSASLIRAR